MKIANGAEEKGREFKTDVRANESVRLSHLF